MILAFADDVQIFFSVTLTAQWFPAIARVFYRHRLWT
jgi:hypothetical protein